MIRRLVLAGAYLAIITALVWSFLEHPPTHHATVENGAPSIIPSAYTSLNDLPIRILENRGRAPSEVLFYGSTAHHTLLFSHNTVSFRRTVHGESEEIVMRFEGSAGAPKVRGLGNKAGRTNLYIGEDRSDWVSDIPTFSSIGYDELYPGVDATFEGTPALLKSSFYVRPGSSPEQIGVSFEGAESIRLREDGALVVKTPFGQWVDGAPVAFQEIEGQKHPVDVWYSLEDDLVRFQVGDYDPRQTLVIDPEVVYATYIGGTDSNSLVGVGIDAVGDVKFYVAGSTTMPDFPGADPTSVGGGSFDIFVARIDPVLGVYDWLTVVGGSGLDLASGYKLAADGSSYLSGSTFATGFPVMQAVQNEYAGGFRDGVALILDSDGNLEASTYLGGSGDDRPQDVDIGPNGELVISGYTDSEDFPTASPLQASNAGLDDYFLSVIEFDGASGSMPFSTYFGGSDDDRGRAVHVDPQGGVWLGGQSQSLDVLLVDPVQSEMASSTDAFLARFANVFPGATGDPSIAFSTYLGGDGFEQIEDVASTLNGDVYFVGSTGSEDFPMVNAVQPTFSGDVDAFGAVLNDDVLVFSSYFGQETLDRFNAVVTTADGCALAAGVRGSSADIQLFCADGTAENLGTVGEAEPFDIALATVTTGKSGQQEEKVVTGGRAKEGGIEPTDGATQTDPPTMDDGSSQNNAFLAAFFHLGSNPTSADLEVVSKSASPNPAYPGETVTFTIRVRNNGPDNVDQAGVVDGLPGGIDFTSVVAGSGCSVAGSVVNCSAPLAAGEVLEFEFTAKTLRDVPEMITNQAVISAGGNLDPNASNDVNSVVLGRRPRVTRLADPNVVFHRLVVIGDSPNGITNPYEETNRLDDFTELAEDLFTPENQAEGSTVRVLREPSQSEFFDAIRELKAMAKPGEQVTFIYMGHGWNGVFQSGRIQDRFEKDEVLGGDEIIWLDGGDITDDQLAAALHTGFSPGVAISVVLGSCYGGGFTDGRDDLKEDDGLTVIGVAGMAPQDGGGALDYISLGASGIFVETFYEAVADGAGEHRADENGDGVVTTQELKDHLIDLDWEIGPPPGQKRAVEPVIRTSQSFCGSAEFGLCPGLADTDIHFAGDSIQVVGRYFGPNTEVSVHLVQTDLQTLDTLAVWTTDVMSDSTFQLAERLPETIDRQTWLLFEIIDTDGFYDWWITFAGTLFINDDGDAPDAAPGDLVCATEGGVCTLRAALEEANALGGPASILTARPIVVAPDSALPVIKDGLYLNGGQRLEINGANLSNGEHGLTISASGSDITSLAIHSFPGAGVALVGGEGSRLSRLRIGTDLLGEEAGNGGPGVFISGSDNNAIGFEGRSEENNIAFNAAGVVIENGSGNNIRFNSFLNTGLAIDLGADGPTANDVEDLDEGPNRLMNAPAIRLAEESLGRFTVHYSVDADTEHAAFPLMIDFYAADIVDDDLTWLAEQSYDAPGNEQTAIFFADHTAGTEIVATATDANGNTSEVSAKTESVVQTESTELPPAELTLGAAYPNPFQGVATIPLGLPNDAHVRVEVFDQLGRRVATLMDDVMRAGRHELTWPAKLTDGQPIVSGNYLIRLETAKEVRTTTLVVVR